MAKKKIVRKGVKSASGLAAKMQKRKGKEISIEHSGGGGFPPGINNGIAQVKTIKIGTYGENTKLAGENYFMVRAVAVLPKKLPDGTPVEGSQDSVIMEPMCATPDRKQRPTEDEHLDYVWGVLQELGIDPDEIDWAAAATDENYFNDYVEAGIYCRYHTWRSEPTKQYPNPRTNVSYDGPAEYDQDGDDETDDELVDETADETTDDESVEEQEEEGEEESTEDEGEDEEEITALGVAADAGDEEAQVRLEELASEHDVNHTELGTWSEVAEAIAEAMAGGSSDEEEEGDKEFMPVKGKVYKYKPAGAKTPVDVEVTAVVASKKTCNLKNLDTQKVYKSVGWDRIIA